MEKFFTSMSKPAAANCSEPFKFRRLTPDDVSGELGFQGFDIDYLNFSAKGSVLAKHQLMQRFIAQSLCVFYKKGQKKQIRGRKTALMLGRAGEFEIGLYLEEEPDREDCFEDCVEIPGEVTYFTVNKTLEGLEAYGNVPFRDFSSLLAEHFGEYHLCSLSYGQKMSLEEFMKRMESVTHVESIEVELALGTEIFSKGE